MALKIIDTCERDVYIYKYRHYAVVWINWAKLEENVIYFRYTCVTMANCKCEL